jgi:hypothetical protein
MPHEPDVSHGSATSQQPSARPSPRPYRTSAGLSGDLDQRASQARTALPGAMRYVCVAEGRSFCKEQACEAFQKLLVVVGVAILLA